MSSLPLLPPSPALSGQTAARPPRQELKASPPQGPSESRPPADKPAATRDTALYPRGGFRKTRQPGGGDGASPSPVQEGGDSASSEEISLRELHVFCRAVRVSVVDGDRGEVVLGSLEGMSMNVAATEAEVEVKFKLGSLQIDNHLPGTSFPVLLQPVRPGYQGGDNKCVRFTLVAAPRVKNVAYIKLASLNVEEFDLRLDEGMVRWAQGLADRVMWTLVADRRADEMDKWPLPQEAFCSSQAGHPGGGKASGENIDGSSVGGGQGSTGMVVSRGGGEGAFASRYVYLEVFQVSSVKVRLSLQRAKDSFDNVYVGVKPGQMLLDLMMRMDSAHIKLKSLIVHNTTTTRSRLTLTAREHYERELKQQAFLMLGSLEAFGNPVGLVRGMGQGMQDFVKEPVLGLLKSVEDLAPEELMHGMARGAGSLLNHSVGGVANSVSLITGTVSQNLTTLAMDKEYKLKRARRKDARGENKDVLDGIGSAGGSLARGLTDGVSGLIKNPLKGAESGGLAGFAKGVGTGMLGLVVKPVVGVTDAATDLLQGVRGTTASIAQIGKPSPSASPYHQTAGPPSAGHGRGGSLGAAGDGGGAIGGGGAGGWDEGVGQVRPRRVLYGSMRTLRPYAIEDARAAALLRTTRYKEEEYAAHLEISQAAGAGATSKPTSAVVILTQSLVLLLRVPGGEVVLEQRLAGIQAVEIKAEGVLLHLHPPSTPKAPRQGASGYLGLPPPPSEEDDGPGGGRNRGRVQARGIPCREEASKRRLYDLLDAAVKNAARAL
ncbi:conserved unknown protein [Ectocarpus siliculosus]|uniref:Vacuolar protein sorting-associated protein 13 DH-like domain-containing protein n=1 Tax=Ectocarpus siliculosus TaxID=2880 RepID=D7FMF7_ECTSI|nr:conserved unknown protein [Ectocarpus siliculosus]|eukprot:CBJ29969.1 conserved unknown protein [Ectocarpus siliculosus]